MIEEKKSLFELCVFFFAKYKIRLAVFAAAILIFIFVNYDIDDFEFTFESNFNIYVIIALIIIVFAFCSLKIVKRTITFEEKSFTLEITILFAKIRKTVEYENISNVIIGRILSNRFISHYCYSIYLVKNDKIVKIISFESYQGCLEIMKNIKSKTKIKIYDDTERCYTLEEDLFRNYYKMKNMVNEIKNNSAQDERT